MAAERAVLLLVSVNNEGAGPTLLVSGTAAAAQEEGGLELAKPTQTWKWRPQYETTATHD